MTEAAQSTKDALIEAAGQLFAERGVEGTSVRSIVELAGANLAAVNYHFGSKDALYLEVLRTAARDKDDPGAFLDDARAADTPEEMSRVIYRLCRELFLSLIATERPSWKQRVIIRSFLRPSEALDNVVREVFRPHHETIVAICREANKEMSAEEVESFAYTVSAGVFFYWFARTPILMYRQWDSYPRDFIEFEAWHLARLTARGLGLPEPVPEAEFRPGPPRADGNGETWREISNKTRTKE